MYISIFDVEFRLNTKGELYQHFLKKANGDDFRCTALVKKALGEALQELLEKKVMAEDG